jgi:hypothetical protein
MPPASVSNGGFVQIRKDIHRHIGGGDCAIDHEDQGENQNKQPIFQAAIDDPAKHVRFLSGSG